MLSTTVTSCHVKKKQKEATQTAQLKAGILNKNALQLNDITVKKRFSTNITYALGYLL